MKNKKPSDKKYDKDEEKRKNEIDLDKAQTQFKLHCFKIRKWLNWLVVCAVASLVLGRICATIGLNVKIEIKDKYTIHINEPFDLIKELVSILQDITDIERFICVCFTVCFVFACKTYREIKLKSREHQTPLSSL